MPLRYYQEEAVQAMFAAKDNGVIVLPTASGKSHVIRGFAQRYPGKLLVVSHVKEILEQNFNKLTGVPDIGLYSAGLGVKHKDRITVAGIQSIYKNPWPVDKVLIDECHLVSDAGMYKQLLGSLGVPFIGLTATPHRLKDGHIYEAGGMFDSITYEAPVKRLTEEGYLCPLVYYSDKESFDVEGLRVTGGDYNIKDMSLRYNREEVTRKVVQRVNFNKFNKVLVFCIDIKHAEQVAKELNLFGVSAEAVHSESPRDQAILDFKAGKIKVLTNVNVLTTGFDVPEIDMIVVLRPTKSLTLHQQMLGRGMRIHPSKTETLIKDFTKNTITLGTVEDPAPIDPPKRGKRKGPNPFAKECPDCFKINHPSVRVCECGHKFQFKHGIALEAYTGPVTEWYTVTRVAYFPHQKTGKPKSIKVSYICGMKVFNEYVLPEHPGFVGHKSRYWISRRYHGEGKAPITVTDFLRSSSDIDEPLAIEVDTSEKYPKIINYKWN